MDGADGLASSSTRSKTRYGGAARRGVNFANVEVTVNLFAGPDPDRDHHQPRLFDLVAATISPHADAEEYLL